MRNRSLAKKSLHAIKWNYIGIFLMVVLQFSVVIFLARTLGPAPFGFLSIAMIITGIGNILVSFGIGEALIQKDDIGKKDISSAYTALTIFGFTAFIITIIFSNSIADLFNSITYAPALKVISITFIFHSLGIVSRSILRRNMDFKYIQLVQITSYFIGFFVVGIVSAINGQGEWSFVYALLCQSFSASLLMYIRVRHPISFGLDKEVSNLLLFGSKIVRTNLLNWIIENLDNILIGRFFGSTQLGLYSVTYNLVRTPVNHLVVSLQGVMFPLAARIKEREKQLSTLFYAFISIISIATFPIFISVSSLSELILNALYGDEWILASKVLIPISLAMPLHAIMAITGPLLWGIGRVEKELNIQLFIAIAFSISMLIACQISMVFAAWTVLFIYAARAIMMIYILSTVLQIERAKVLNNIKGGILLGIMVSASLYIINFLMDNALSSPMFKLLILIVFGALTLLGYSYLLRRFIITEEIVYLLESISNQSSEKVKQLIEKYLLIPTR